MIKKAVGTPSVTAGIVGDWGEEQQLLFCDPLRLASASWRAAARRKGERVHSLLIVLFQREAAAADFGDAADDEEALRVDGMDELFQLG